MKCKEHASRDTIFNIWYRLVWFDVVALMRVNIICDNNYTSSCLMFARFIIVKSHARVPLSMYLSGCLFLILYPLSLPSVDPSVQCVVNRFVHIYTYMASIMFSSTCPYIYLLNDTCDSSLLGISLIIRDSYYQRFASKRYVRRCFAYILWFIRSLIIREFRSVFIYVFIYVQYSSLWFC